MSEDRSAPDGPFEPVRRIHTYGGGFSDLSRPERAALLEGREVVALTDDTFRQEIEHVEVLFCHGPPGDTWERAGNLRLIQTVGTGVDSLLPAVGLDPDVPIANAGGTSSEAMAEFAVGALLTLVKKFPAAAANQRDRSWRLVRPGKLDGRTVLVAGLGPVGRRTAQMLAPFGVDVIGLARKERPIDGFARIYGRHGLEAALTEADDLVIALPLTPETNGLVGERELELLGERGHVINVARGGIVDEVALESMLRGGRLAGAVIDAFAQEPLPPESTLWDCPGMVITAHESWTTEDYGVRLVGLLVENIHRVERGLDPINLVDRRLGYPAAG